MMRPDRRRRGVPQAVAAVSAVITGSVVLVAPGAPGHAQAPGDVTAPPPAVVGTAPIAFGDDGTATTVTLVTGDVVHLNDAGDGRTAVSVAPAPRSNGVVPSFQVTSRDDATYVVPSDVAQVIPDRLDMALFNVTYLTENGYADLGSGLPVILDYRDDRRRTFRTEPIPGTENVRELPSVDAAAAVADLSGDSEFSAAVRQLGDAAPGEPAATYRDGDAGPLADVEKVWLDARVEAYLDESTGQISAPAAWAAGLDGSGVTVAVLDSGIDTSHPDLDQRVAKAADFTWEERPGDPLGHGTHVASILGGSGEAADGAKRGVAPGATLLDGRVLDGEGGGYISWIIAGMEWAAEEGADIVNMSLGLHAGHVESPFLTEALESISAAHDTLFVVAAGNGYCDRCVGSPGDAPSALTVGAVDREDQLADFSSRGPTFFGSAMKPDVTAPGMQISAARADGTGDVDGSYIAYSGTSMAAPHVAGVAALALDAHPDLDAQELKGLLASTAVPTDGLNAYQQGSGRVDAARAVSSTVFTTPSAVDFGKLEFSADAEPLVHELVYRNIGTEPVTIDLKVDGDVPVTVEPAQLTIGAGGSATAEVTFEPALAEPGTAAAAVVGAGDDGTHLRTPVGFVLEEEHFEVTLSAIARDGRPAKPHLSVIGSNLIDLESGEPAREMCDSEPMDHCFRVPHGTYAAMAYVFTKPEWAVSDGDPHTTNPLHTALVGDPEIVIDADTHLTFDAREAVEVTVETPAHDAAANPGGAVELAWSRTPANGPATVNYHLNQPGGQLEERFFMQPMDEVSIGSFTATTRWRLQEPDITLTVAGDEDFPLSPVYVNPIWHSEQSWEFPMLDGTAKLTVVDAGDGSADAIGDADLSGSLALIERSDDIPVAEQSNAAAAAGAEFVAIYNDTPGVNDTPGSMGTALQVPTVRLSREDGLALLDRLDLAPVTVVADGRVVSSYAYDLVYAERGGIADNLTYVAHPDGLATVEREFHEQLDGMSFTEAAFAFQPGSDVATGILWAVRGAPGTRTDYHTADPEVAWQHVVETPEAKHNHLWPDPLPPAAPLQFANRPIRYSEGERDHQRWFRQPLSPGLRADRPITRYGDILHIPIAGIVDADGNFARRPSTFRPEGGFSALFQIWHDDEILGETTGAPTGTLLLPAANDTFRITYEITNDARWASLSTETKTEWTFNSERAPETGEVQPLMTLGYDLPTDLSNRLRDPSQRRGPNLVEVNVGHQEGVNVPIGSLTFDVSYDDGRTWRALRPHRLGDGRYTVNLGSRTPGSGTGYVSFRVSAEDVDGNRIEQEIIRAAAQR